MRVRPDGVPTQRLPRLSSRMRSTRPLGSPLAMPRVTKRPSFQTDRPPPAVPTQSVPRASAHRDRIHSCPSPSTMPKRATPVSERRFRPCSVPTQMAPSRLSASAVMESEESPWDATVKVRTPVAGSWQSRPALILPRDTSAPVREEDASTDHAADGFGQTILTPSTQAAELGADPTDHLHFEAGTGGEELGRPGIARNRGWKRVPSKDRIPAPIIPAWIVPSESAATLKTAPMASATETITGSGTASEAGRARRG